MAEEENNEQVAKQSSNVEVEDVTPKKNIVLYILVAVNFIVIIVLFVRQLGLNKKLAEYQEQNFISRKVKISNDVGGIQQIFELKPMTINLAEWNGPRRYLKLSMNLSVEAKNLEEMEAKKTSIRDLVIKLVNKKNPEDLLSDGGVDKIKSEIMESVNKVLSESKIVRIYFTDYRVN